MKNNAPIGSVYLLHFEPAFKHARHYIGWSQDINQREAAHHSGRGSRLVQYALQAGCTVTLARVWEGRTRAFERQLKRRKEAPRLCPICRGDCIDRLPVME